MRSELTAREWVLADEAQLKVVIRNLAANAIKFTEPGGEVCFAAVDKGNKLEVSVRDTGVGISAEKLPLLFKPDSHFSEAGTSKEKGSGLGLILCKEFLENMGASLQVKSIKGAGSTFYFELSKAAVPTHVQ